MYILTINRRFYFIFVNYKRYIINDYTQILTLQFQPLRIDYFLFRLFTSLLSITIRSHVTHPGESGVALPLYVRGDCDATPFYLICQK